MRSCNWNSLLDTGEAHKRTIEISIEELDRLDRGLDVLALLLDAFIGASSPQGCAPLSPRTLGLLTRLTAETDDAFSELLDRIDGAPVKTAEQPTD